MDQTRLRKLIHDLRASQHAIRLNVEAAQILAGKLSGDTAAQLQRHLSLLANDVKKFSDQLEELSTVLKK